MPCSELDNGYYFSDGLATRLCNADGSWLPTDYSNCSVKTDVKSFGLIWMILAISNGNYVFRQLERIQNDVSVGTTLHKHLKTYVGNIIMTCTVFCH